MLKDNISFTQPVTLSSSGDALSQVLDAMRISGSILLKEKYKSPWAVSVSDSMSLGRLLGVSKNIRIAAFHMVERGCINIATKKEDDILVEAGEIAVCFSGVDHTLYQGDEKNAVSFQEIMAGNKNIFEPKEGEKTPCTSLVCGIFMLHDTLLNPLLSALPDVLKFSISDPDNYPRIHGVINLLAQEFKYKTAGNNYVVQRYLEILCAESIRAYVEILPEHSKGWLAALKDPAIGRAIEMIHTEPGYNWSVKHLANEVAISPSRFAAKFTSELGESPMIYVTKWRMFVASQMLKQGQHNISQIANDVGYESLASFSRAFKRHVGLPPATWRSTFSQ